MGIAHELITRGWTRYKMLDPETGAVCLEGAAYCSAGLADELGTANIALRMEPPEFNALRKVLGQHTLYWWNDEPDRTYDEVLRVAKEADELLGQ